MKQFYREVFLITAIGFTVWALACFPGSEATPLEKSQFLLGMALVFAVVGNALRGEKK